MSVTNGVMDGERILRQIMINMKSRCWLFGDWESAWFAGQITLAETYGEAPKELVEQAHALRESLKGTIPCARDASEP